MGTDFATRKSDHDRVPVQRQARALKVSPVPPRARATIGNCPVPGRQAGVTSYAHFDASRSQERGSRPQQGSLLCALRRANALRRYRPGETLGTHRHQGPTSHRPLFLPSGGLARSGTDRALKEAAGLSGNSPCGGGGQDLVIVKIAVLHSALFDKNRLAPESKRGFKENRYGCRRG